MHSNYRWLVLLSYTMVLGLNQMLWLNFAPLISQLQHIYPTVSQNWVGMLIMVFPICYVLFSIPSGLLVDRLGYRWAVSLSVIVMFIGTLIRIQASFEALLIGQLCFALVQPLILNSISKLVADWFEAEQMTLATGLASSGMFAGMIVGMGLSPGMLIHLGLRNMMIIFAGIAAFVAAAYLIFGKQRTHQKAHGDQSIHIIFKLLRHKNLVAMCCITALAIGAFNGIMTWIQPMLSLTDQEAGIFGSLLIIGGVFGSAMIPPLIARWHAHKVGLFVACVGSALLMMSLDFLTNIGLLHGVMFFMGFILLTGYPVLLTLAEKDVGFEHAGAGTGLLLLSGNLGGAIIGFVMPWIAQKGWSLNINFLMFLLLGAAAVALFILKDARHDSH